MYSPRSAATGELAGASERLRACLFWFHLSSGPTIGLMGAAARRDNLVPRAGRGNPDFESTVAGRKAVKRLGKWAEELHWQDLVTSTVLRQVLKRLQVDAESSMATNGTPGRRVNGQSLCIPRKKMWYVRKNGDTPRHSRPTPRLVRKCP